ncbi:MAG TPA: hypothetical protein VF618_19285 [Thermoanaerobaculia bacterium]
MTPETRERLGSYGLTQRRTVFATQDGLETVARNVYDVGHERVLWDDVMMVTRHREHGWSAIIVGFLIAAFFIGIAVAIMLGSTDAWIVALIFFGMGFPFLFVALSRLFLGVDVVTVYGRRSSTSIRWIYRKARAVETYTLIIARARAAQRHLEQQIRAEEAAYQVATTEMPPLPDDFAPPAES